MSLFLLSLTILAFLGGFLTLLGRVLCAAVRTRWLQAPTLENYLLAAALGTSAWLLAFGLLSHLGLAAPAAAQGLLMATVVLLAPVAWRNRDWLKFRRPGWVGWGAAAVAALTLNLTLLPASVGNAFPPFGDQYTYVSISAWLQDHGFSETCVDDPEHPCLRQIWIYQTRGFRMGAIFFLASVEGLLGGRYNALDVFPAVLTWGMLLCFAGMYLLCRWCLRVSPAGSLLALLLAALTFNPLYFSSYSGLLPQLYGLATLAHATALLARLAPRGRWHVGSALLVGLTGSGLISTYNEFAPFLCVLGVVFTIRHYLRARQQRRGGHFLRFAGLMLAALFVTGNIEYLRMLVALPTQFSIRVGMHQSWSALEFWEFASGVKSIWHVFPGWLSAAACAAASVLILLGLFRLKSCRQAEPLLVTAGLLMALTVYFAVIARDPWTSERGHTWSLYKLCQWGFPTLVALQAAGIERLFRWRATIGVAAGITLPLAAAWVFLPVHVEQSVAVRNYLRNLACSPRPFHAWKQIGPRLDQLGVRQIYFVNDPSRGWFPGAYAAYFLWPRPFASGTAMFSGRYDERPVSNHGDGTAVVAWSRPPFSKPHETLPGGFSLLDREEPVILHVHDHLGLFGPAHQRGIWAGTKSVELPMWAPRDGRARLAFHVEPVDKTAFQSFRIQWSHAGHKGETRLRGEPQSLAIDLSLPMGLSRFTLHFSDTAPEGQATKQAPTTPVAKVSDVQFYWTQATTRAR